MKITIFGAAGAVGSRVVSEALSRGHEVKAVMRDPAQFNKLPAAAILCSGDASSVKDVARLSAGQDLVITAIRPPTGHETQLASITQSILRGVAQSAVRVLVVGGAASLRLPDQGETTVLSAPNFLPAAVMPIARACFAQHEMCTADQQADWAYLSPPAMLVPGTRTGSYRLGFDELVVDQHGNSKISMEDFAVVLIDEAEQPKHRRTRFTAAY